MFVDQMGMLKKNKKRQGKKPHIQIHHNFSDEGFLKYEL